MRTLRNAVNGLCLLAVAGAGPGAGSRPAAAVEYRVDPETSELVVRLFKGGIASAFAHDHVIEATSFSGSVIWDPARPGEARVRLTVDARELVADRAAQRAEHGLDKKLSDDDRAEIQSTMESDEQLDVQAHPEMSFTSTSVRVAEGGGVEVSGDLRLHGTTHVVTFTSTPRVDNGTFAADAEIPFRQSDYGIEPYRAMLGAIRNKDEARLIVHLVAVEQPRPTTPSPGTELASR
ncbi:MAG TPA: YceI family protein [Candidatus Sulfomarinibacteraceae bacterium]|nr:YceI family protein [Candidatus Sulfomarinibacteraceae bacterium]